MNAHRISIENRSALASSDAADVALDCLTAGIEAAHPRTVVSDTLSLDEAVLAVRSVDGATATYELDTYERVLVLGGGNAAGHFAAALEALLGERIDGGAVVTDDPVETEHVEVLPGDHPVPSKRGVESAARVLDLADCVGSDDLVIGCITGGGSALLPAPAGELSLADLRTTTDALLASGAPIEEINAVRKHLSAIKGGRLARAVAPATVVGLAISDVVGDDPAVIASGPLSPDSTTFRDTLDVLDRRDVDVPDPVREHLRAGAGGDFPETPTADDTSFDRAAVHVVASAHTALDTAREVATEHDYETMVLSARVRGEAREAAKTHAAVAEEIATMGDPIETPAIVLSGARRPSRSATTTDRGPNQEFVLSGAVELGVPAVVAAVDTDGIDGATDAAGAIADADTVDDTAARDALSRNDAYPVLENATALLRTGATGTNVNDLRVLVVEERQ
ncbi:glycerate kinase [Natronoarchaeum sp. GCM10025703]|uniref:glycerate kinase type-2 family protein n=1 Tax=Natronoarchaeum sp. GCM10025703 TaxID=3252685 RepID=UPI003608E88B